MLPRSLLKPSELATWYDQVRCTTMHHDHMLTPEVVHNLMVGPSSHPPPTMRSPCSADIHIVSDSIGNCYNASGTSKATFAQDLYKLLGDPWRNVRASVTAGMTLHQAGDQVSCIREECCQCRSPGCLASRYRPLHGSGLRACLEMGHAH